MTTHDILKKYWGYDHFRALQEEIIDSVLEGKDTLALLPTGGGKSVCFQVPVLAKEGIGIVVSPLIALMKDQVENLKKRGIKAVALTSGMGKREVDIMLDNCVYGDIKFLYLSPERLRSELVTERIKRMNVNLIAVDEAHCVSQWGYDFRPPYLQIADLRTILPGVPILALTASATPEVREDIQDQLKFTKKNVFCKSFERSNLHYLVIEEENKEQRLLRILEKQPGSAIIYVRNRKQTADIARFLNRNGISADHYHAGDDPLSRSQKQQQWVTNQTRVIVATNAFGMGIDKPDVRLVIHLDIPDSLEAYYQEAGRAGRDEQKAYAVLLYCASDLADLQTKYIDTFPDVAFLKELYDQLAGEFQLAIGSSSYDSYDFDLVDFSKKHQYNPLKVLNGLKLLEKNNLLSLSESIYMPSRVFFTAPSSTVYEFQVAHAEWDVFIKLLLRSYSGLFTNYVRINEKELARRAGLSEREIKTKLTQLQTFDLIDYVPVKTKPQVEFLTERLPRSAVSIDAQFVFERKRILTEKIGSMVRYATFHECRSIQILRYFGEKEAKPCGQCDVCIEDRKLKRPVDARQELFQLLESFNNAENVSLPLIFDKLRHYSQQTVMEAIQFHVEEGTIQFNDKNEVIIKPK